MKVSEMIDSLKNIRREYGNIDLHTELVRRKPEEENLRERPEGEINIDEIIAFKGGYTTVSKFE